METQVNKLSKSQSYNWLTIAEIVAVAGSVGGTIAGILLQKFFYASVPLSASVAFSLFNRQRMKSLIDLKEIRIEQLEQQNQQSTLRLSELSQKFDRQNELTSGQFSGRLEAEEKRISNILQEIQKIRQHLIQVNTLNDDLDKSFNSLNKQQVEISKLIEELSVSENQSQNTLSVSDPADFCFNLALVNQERGNSERAIENYTKALEINPSFTLAYHNRGLLYKEIGNNRQAIDDLRKASQLYFKQNDLEKYQEIRNLSLELYNKEKVSDTSIQLNQDKIAAHNLFD